MFEPDPLDSYFTGGEPWDIPVDIKQGLARIDRDQLITVVYDRLGHLLVDEPQFYGLDVEVAGRPAELRLLSEPYGTTGRRISTAVLGLDPFNADLEAVFGKDRQPGDYTSAVQYDFVIDLASHSVQQASARQLSASRDGEQWQFHSYMLPFPYMISAVDSVPTLQVTRGEYAENDFSSRPPITIASQVKLLRQLVEHAPFMPQEKSTKVVVDSRMISSRVL